MQSTILLAVMILASVFMAAEMSRNNHGESNAVNKSKNVAANILQYQDIVIQHVLKKYATLHLNFSVNVGHVEEIALLDYKKNNLDVYSQKNFATFLNYRTVIFNYAQSIPNETQITPVLYVATSFDSYPEPEIYKIYSKTRFPEVMGHLGESLSKHLYQGNSDYWTVPWLFSQKDCKVVEIYSQIPDDAASSDGRSNYRQVQALFNKFCNQIQTSGSYTFLDYVYMQPVFNPANI